MDQSAPPGSAGANNLIKGRRRDQGAVKISCARQDPNARNCHGYRKFVKRSVLENPAAGYLVNDTLVIRYTIELVVSTGGALAKPNGRIGGGGGLGVGSLRGLGGRGGNRGGGAGGEGALLPPPSLGVDLARLLDSGAGADVEFEVEGELFRAHRIVLSARSPVFDALLNGGMREAREVLQLGGAAGAQDGGDDAERRPSPASCGGSPPPLLPRIKISDVRAPVFRALLHFAYTDELPSEIGSTSGGSAGGGEAAAATSAGEAAAAPSTALAVAAPSSRPPAATTTAAFAAALSTVGAALDVPMAQHLLVAADRFALSRLRRICERRLCERVDISTAATTLALAEQNNASDLKRVCLAFVSRNLQAVMASEGYQHMVRNFFFCRFVFSSLCFSPGFFISIERNRSNGKKKKKLTPFFLLPLSRSQKQVQSCPNLQAELLAAIAANPAAAAAGHSHHLRHESSSRHRYTAAAASLLPPAAPATASLLPPAAPAAAAAANNNNDAAAMAAAAAATAHHATQQSTRQRPAPAAAENNDGDGDGRRVRPRAE